eukprot:226447_1
MTLNAACKRAAMECGHSAITRHQDRLTRCQNRKSIKPKYEFAADGEAIVKPGQFWLFYDSKTDIRLCKILQIFHKYSSCTVPMRFNSVNDKSGFLWIQILVPQKIESLSVNTTAMESNIGLFTDVPDDNIPSNFTIQLEPVAGDSEMVDADNIPAVENKMDIELEPVDGDSEMVDVDNIPPSVENKMDIESVNNVINDAYEIKDELSMHDNMTLLRLLPMTQLYKKISDIHDPNVITQIELSDFPTLKEWKTFWNSNKNDMKRYQFSCELCLKKFIRKTAYEKHLIACKSELNDISKSTTDNSSNSSAINSKQKSGSSRPIKHRCKYCDKPYKNTKSWQKHEQNCKELKQYPTLIPTNSSTQSDSSNSNQNNASITISNEEIATMEFQTHSDISVAEKFNFLAKSQVTLDQLLKREAEYKGKNAAVVCKILKKQDISNFTDCPLNKFPNKVPNYNDKAFHNLRWPFLRRPNDANGPLAIDGDENGLNEDGLTIDKCYVLYIKNMGFYEK